MTAIRFTLVIHLLVLMCGCSNEARAEDSPTPEAKPAASRDSAGSQSVKVTEVSRAVITLTIQGMKTDSDAKDVSRTLDRVFGVEKVKVDLETMKATCLMEEGIERSDVSGKIKTLRGALDDPYSVTGFSYDFHSSTSLKGKW